MTPRWGVAPTEVAGKSQLFGQVVLGTGPGDRDIQAEKVSFRFPAGYIFGKAGSVIVHEDELLFNERSEMKKER